jgi:hypothetical protein
LLDYALALATETEIFVSVKMVTALLKYGARPNKCETNSGTSSQRNALSYLNVIVLLMEPGPRKAQILSHWVRIIEILLKEGADPDTGCPKLMGCVNSEHGKVPSDGL